MAVEYEPDTVLAAARGDSATYKRLAVELATNEVPMARRLRALFTLKSLGGAQAVSAIAAAFNDEPSALLKHELAYVLGQMHEKAALPTLIAVLEDRNEDPMVRHEAAEALGAISDPSALAVLRSHLADPERCVRETCELAVSLIEFNESQRSTATSDVIPSSAYASIDPAPALSGQRPILELREVLLDTKLSLFKRYRAMFALRNLNTEEAVLALADGFADSSALFRHEIAYVMGQMQNPAAVPALIQVLSNTTEEGMVRHECAEALGSIAHPDVMPVLTRFAQDSEPVVRESCVVGLDMAEYETSQQFQYADGLNA